MDALELTLKTEHVVALSDAYYKKSHREFEDVSTQRKLLADALGSSLQEIQTRFGRAIDWLSVGCGAGELDTPLLESHAGTIRRYTGIDPNHIHLESFKIPTATASRTNLVHSTFEAWGPDNQYDVVSAIHVIYYTNDAEGFVKKILQTLRKGGRAIIAIAPLSPMNRLAKAFWAEQGTYPIFSEQLTPLLEKLGVRYSQCNVEAMIPLAHYITDTKNQAIIDFTVQAATTSLSPEGQELLQSAFTAAAVEVDGQKMLQHPVDYFVIERK